MAIAAFLETAFNTDFQQHRITNFSTGRTLIKHRNMPQYRKIDRYYKTPQQYQKERQRRKVELILIGKGYSLSQIAKALHVSKRTVQRDLAKTESYLKSQVNAAIHQFHQEQKQPLEHEVANMTMAERFEQLTKLMVRGCRMDKARANHTYNILINLDDCPNGLPRIISQAKNCTLSSPWSLGLIMQKDGVKYKAGGFTIG